MPSRTAVSSATLTQNDVTWLLPYIKQSKVYSTPPGQYPNIEADLRAKVVAGDYPSKFIAACLPSLEVLTDNMVELDGGRDAIHFDLEENREQIIRLILSVLYDISLTQIATYSDGVAAAAQIPLKGNCCPNCFPHPCCCSAPY